MIKLILAISMATALGASLLLQQPQTGPWTPRSDSNLQLWLDPTDNTTITQVSNNVSQWNDKSTHTNNFTQSTGANQFVVTSSAVNSLQAMASGASKAMKGPANMFISTGSAWTFAMSGKITSYNNHYGFVMGFEDGVAGHQYIVTLADSTQTGYVGLNAGPTNGISASYAQLLYNATISANTVFKLIITYSGSSPTSTGSYEIWWNGTSRTVTTNGGGWGNSNDGQTMLGTPLANNAGFGMSGYIGDVMFFSAKNSTLTTNINTFLSRWGV